MKNSKLSKILSLVVIALVGLFLVIYPGDTLNIVVGVFGCALLLIGVIGIVSYFLPKNKNSRSTMDLLISIVEAIVGPIVVSNISFVISLFPIFAGVIIALQGVLYLISTLRMKSDNNSWKLGLVLSLVMIAFGILIIANPFATQATLVRLTGVALIYNAISGIIIRLKA